VVRGRRVLTPPTLTPALSLRGGRGTLDTLAPGGAEGRVRGPKSTGQVREHQRRYARRLRRDQTDVERKLWSRLRDRRLCGVRFRRQHPIGPFIVDFCSIEANLVIELDGGQHALQARSDAARTEFLRRQGYRVLRFWDNEALANIDAVLQRIVEALRADIAHPHPNPLPPTRERGPGNPRPRRGRGQGEGV